MNHSLTITEFNKISKNFIHYFLNLNYKIILHAFFLNNRTKFKKHRPQIIYNYHSCRFIEVQQLKIYYISYSNTNKDSRRSFLAINTYQFPWIILWQSQNSTKFQKTSFIISLNLKYKIVLYTFFFWIKEQNSKKYRPQNNIQLSFLPIYRRQRKLNFTFQTEQEE